MDGFGSNVDVDLQQRGVEFGQLFRSQAAIRPQILEPMPAMERSRSLEIGGPQIPASTSSTALLENGVSEAPVVQESSSTLIDLLGLGDPGETVAEPAVQSSGNMGDILGLGVAPAPTGNLLDGLGGLDLGGPVPSALPATNGGLDNLLNGVDTAAFVTPKETPSLVAYEKHGLRVVFTFPTATATAITLLAHNLTGSSIQEFVFQVIIICNIEPFGHKLKLCFRRRYQSRCHCSFSPPLPQPFLLVAQSLNSLKSTTLPTPPSRCASRSPSLPREFQLLTRWTSSQTSLSWQARRNLRHQ